MGFMTFSTIKCSQMFIFEPAAFARHMTTLCVKSCLTVTMKELFMCFVCLKHKLLG